MLVAASIKMALAILERDGLWVLYGLGLALVAAAVVSGVILAAVKATLFALSRLLH